MMRKQEERSKEEKRRAALIHSILHITLVDLLAV